MGIAKSKDTMLDVHGGGRIRSSLARAAGAIGLAIERVGTFFALAVTSVLALASTVATWGPSVSMDQADESVVRLPFFSSPVSYAVTFILAAALIASCIAWCRRRGKAEIAPWMPIAVLAIACSASSIPKRAFEGRVGYDLGDGIPTVAWFEIGLGDESVIGEGMPGW